MRKKNKKSLKLKRKFRKQFLPEICRNRIYAKLTATVWTFDVSSEEPLLIGYLQVSVIWDFSGDLPTQETVGPRILSLPLFHILDIRHIMFS